MVFKLAIICYGKNYFLYPQIFNSLWLSQLSSESFCFMLYPGTVKLQENCAISEEKCKSES